MTPSSRSRKSAAPAAAAGGAEATCRLPPAAAAEATTSAAPEASKPSTRLPWRCSRASGRASRVAGAGGVVAVAGEVAAAGEAGGNRLDVEAGAATGEGAAVGVAGAAEPVLGAVTVKKKSPRLITTRRTRTGRRSCFHSMRRRRPLAARRPPLRPGEVGGVQLFRRILCTRDEKKNEKKRLNAYPRPGFVDTQGILY